MIHIINIFQLSQNFFFEISITISAYFGTKPIQTIYTKMKATGPRNGPKESKVGSKGFLKKIFEYQHGICVRRTLVYVHVSGVGG